MVHTHPGWFLVDQAGRRRLLERDSYALLNPCLPEVRAHLRSVLSELVALYALDGLQLDYVRFLDRDLRAGQDVPFDAATLRRFRAESGASPSERPEAWDRFRRGCLDALVEDLSAAVREKRPRMALSVAAIRDREHARSHLLQDVETWARRGWIDEVYPMAYEPDLTRFSHLVASWTRSRLEAPLVMGIGLHVLRDPRDLLEQVRRLEQPPPAGGRGPAGFCLFSYGELFLSRSPFVRRDRPAGERRSRLRAALGEL